MMGAGPAASLRPRALAAPPSGWLGSPPLQWVGARSASSVSAVSGVLPVGMAAAAPALGAVLGYGAAGTADAALALGGEPAVAERAPPFAAAAAAEQTTSGDDLRGIPAFRDAAGSVGEEGPRTPDTAAPGTQAGLPPERAAAGAGARSGAVPAPLGDPALGGELVLPADQAGRSGAPRRGSTGDGALGILAGLVGGAAAVPEAATPPKAPQGVPSRFVWRGSPPLLFVESAGSAVGRDSAQRLGQNVVPPQEWSGGQQPRAGPPSQHLCAAPAVLGFGAAGTAGAALVLGGGPA